VLRYVKQDAEKSHLSVLTRTQKARLAQKKEPPCKGRKNRAVPVYSPELRVRGL
jgi:hypothetical protein